jgi:hypothetical protein
MITMASVVKPVVISAALRRIVGEGALESRGDVLKKM